MRKILKKVSASLILILMIFSVSFNVLNYSYSVYATNINEVTQIGTSKEYDDYTDVNASESVMINKNSSLSLTYPHLSTKMVEILGESDSRRYNDLLDKIEVTCKNIVSSFPHITMYDCTEDDQYTVEKHGDAALYVDGTQGTIIYVRQIRDYQLLHECGHILNLKMTGLNVNVREMLVIGYMIIINQEANKIYNDFPTINILSDIINKTKEEYKAGLAIYAYYENHGYENMKTILPQINNCSSPKDAIAKIVQISGKTSKECFGTYTEQLVSWGLLELKEDITTSVSSITLIGNNANKANTIDYTQGDTQVTVTVVVKSDEQPQSVKIKLGDKEQTITIANKNGDTYTYTTSIDVSTTTTQEQLLRDKEYTVIVKDANGKEKTYKKSLKVEDEEVADGAIEIGDIGISQPDGDGNGIFNSEKGDTITIQVQVDGIENEEDITKSTVKLDGFKVENTDISIDENGQATVTITMKKTEDIELEEGETTGKVTIIANGKTITETFDIEITNEEKVEDDGIVIKYYDYDEKKYVTIDEDTKELNITADGRYVFSVKMSGVDEERKVFAVIGDNEYIFGDSNGSYVKGITFKQNGTYNIKLCVSDEIVKELKLNLNIVSENKHLVLYALKNKDDLDIPEGWDQGATEEYSFGNHGTGGEDYFIFTDVNDSKKSYFCFEHGASLDPSDHYVLFDAEEYTGLEDEHKLILAYLAETNEFSSESDRYAAQQYYIWLGVKGQQVNCGKFTELLTKLMTLPNNKNDYIDLDEGTITVNGETKKINLDTFKAIEYIARAQYSYDGTVFELGDYVQPFFTYTYETEDVPTTLIQLKKINEQGEPIEGVTFTILKWNSEGKLTELPDGSEFTTNEEGLTDIIPIEDGKYFISETKVPKGYKPTKQYVILNVENGECSYEVKEAYDQALDSNGCVAVPSGPSEPDGEKASGELDWNSGEVEEDGEIELLLEVTNKIKKTDLELEILKTDSSTGEPLNGVSFSINIPGLYSGTLTTYSDGKAKTETIKKENIEPGTYQGTIEETVELKGYEKIDPINFTVEVKADGTISIEGTNVSTNATDELITATFAIKNTKKEEEKPPKEPDNPDEPSNPGSGVELPLLMSINGKVWLDQPQGKNSETNGEYDEGSDKLLEGITVKIYEADGKTPAKFANKSKVQSILNNQNNTKYLTSDLLQNLKSKANKIPDTNEIKTDEKGEFEFVGLDPDKKYTVEFEYNGMRYQEIMASIGVEGCGTPSSIQTTAKAVEDEGRRAEITQMFSEIGPYPNNYEGKLVFTQTEVENYEKKGELPDGVSESQMKQFIEDTKMHAKIKDLGGILQEAEQQLLVNNSGLDTRISSDFKFPVVKSSGGRIPMSQPDKYKEWLKNFNDGYLKGTNIVGKYVLTHEYYEYVEINEYAPHYSDNNPNNHVQIYHEKNEPAEYDGEESLIKGISKDIPLNKPKTTGHMCRKPSIDEYGNITYCTSSVGTFVNFGEKDLEKSYWECTLFYVSEGYATKVEQDENTLTRIATFDTSDEPLYDYDKTSGKTGIEDGKWGWIGLTDIDDNNIKEDEGKEGLGKLYNMLVKKIEELEPKDQDLCLVYRPTVDLGLYNDVQKAVVTINNQTETYIYDKRAANGGIFKFGVNEYDIENGQNAKGNDEEAYADYYQSLSDGNPDPGENEVAKKDYDPIGIRKEDVNINLSGNGSITTNGTAIAGGYNDYDVSIEMTYRIKIYNQSAVSARVTNILDYYLDTFTFDGVYSDAECTQKIADGTPATGEVKPQGYNVMNIELSSQELKGNDSYEIFVKLHMTDPKGTLGAEGVLDAGYKTFNYAEINGYGTNIGVIDIDSSPGDLVPEKRFEEGPYDDDEGKSPTLIFKNPENASRKMSGVVFEDVDTGKLGVQSYTGQTRNVDGTYTSGSDKPIAGAIVELIEVQENGSPLDSPTDVREGVRAQTQTKEDGTFEFDKIVASNYILRYNYGNNYETVLTKRNQVSGVNLLNEKSYNGETYENTTPIRSAGDVYWYTNTTNGRSYAMDNNDRRKIVTNNFSDLTNEKAEILNSWKDKVPTGIYPKKGNYLIDELIERASMFAETEKMLLDVEYHPRYEQKIVNTDGEGAYEKTYVMDNLNFGIKERERAELQITKKVTKISLVDSSGRPITEGTLDDLIEGKMKYVKWLPNEEDTKGFVDMEIDQELLSGATLKITYEMAVTNTSETSSEQPNTIRNIQLIDYVSNNLNYDISYGNNSVQGWNPVTVQNLMNSGLLNKTSLETDDDSNRIDLLSYQTILTTTIDSLSAGETKKKELTLEKNLSAQEESDFNYENQVEIVRSENQKGRGDYSSIYGNLDPETYTSRKGNLNWEQIDEKNKNGYPQEKTATADDITAPAIRMAEKDSGNAEEVIITPPTGAKGIVLQTYHYVLALIALITTAIGITIIKKHIKIQQ